MSERWPGSLISPTAPTTTGGGAGDSAPGVWTLEQITKYVSNQTWPGTGTPDPQFQYVTALLHGDGTNGGQNNTFLDSSSNNFTITRNGNTTQGSFSPYGNLWSNYFGAGDTRLSIPSASNLQLGSSNFTVEGWVYNTSFGSSGSFIMGKWSYPNKSYYLGFNASYLYFGVSTDGQNDTAQLNAAVSLATNTWYHIAAVRNGNTLYFYLNGNLVGTSACNYTFYSGSDNLWTGGMNGGGTAWQTFGYISNARLVIGTAVYTSNFTPSTTPLTAITNTQYLGCQSNRFVDNSANNATVSITGAPSAQRFSPFQSLATYQTSKIGGSGYFDGSSYLTLSPGSAFAFGTGDFTVEAWIYMTSTPYYAYIIDARNSGQTNTWSFDFGYDGTVNKLSFGTSGTFYIQEPTASAVQLNCWNHVAYTRTGTTGSLYCNGVRLATGTDNNDYNVSPTTSYVGVRYSGTGNPQVVFNGYMSTRVINGTAIYTGSSYAVPTTPFTAIANTSLLLNMINGAIYDNAEMNDLQTVGSAQISTSVVKYGTGSMSFNGSSYLSSPAQNIYQLNGGNWTIEFWLYSTSTPSTTVLLENTSNGVGGYSIQINSSAQLVFYVSSTAITSNVAFSGATWYHVALSRVGGTTLMFVNGNQVGSSSTDAGSTNGGLWVGARSGGSFGLTGYIDDLRITKGYARYWFNFQPPTAAYPNYGGTLQLTYDPNFANTTLLLNGEGTNGAQNNTFLDSSSNAFTITRNGNTTQGSFSPYGSLWSNNFKRSTSDYLYAPNSTNWDIGSSTYSVEAWVCVTTLGVQTAFAGSVNRWWFGYNFTDISASANKLNFGVYTGSSWQVLNSATTVVAGVWYHVAFTFSSGTTNLYINGSLEASSSGWTTNTNTATLNIGAVLNPGYFYGFDGYMSNLRIIKGGSLVYTSNFTPSTTPLTATANTVFLGLQSNRFIDNSTNNYTLTVGGSPSVQRFSPFNPTSTYSTSVIGGSGYFGGYGGGGTDQLTVADNTAFDISGGSWTIEAWIYPTAPSGYQTVISKRGAIWEIGLSGNNFYWYNGTVYTSSATLKASTWNHVAVTWDGSATRMYVNGVLDSNLGSANAGSGAGSVYIGYSGGGQYYTGYMGDLRVLKGTALYTGSTYTIPTSPETNITNTSLLLNYTNAGIPDLAMQNDLQTVGNAQVSTAQYKYGSSSIYQPNSGTNDYLYINNNQSLAFGTGDFTIEAWVNSSNVSYASQKGWLQLSTVAGGFSTNTNNGLWILFGNTSEGKVQVSINNSDIFSGTSVSANTWNHIAVTRNAGTVRLFVNGNLEGSNTNTANLTCTYLVTGYYSATYLMPGYIDDLRITKGLARYVQNFTPPTAALPTY